MIRILFVCHGNICRSTMAQSYFAWLAGENNLSYMFETDSAATSSEEIGNGPHPGTVRELKKHHIPVIPHAARRMTAADAQYYDLLIGMDEENMYNMRRIAGHKYEDKLHLLLDFAPDASHKKGREVDDPWYTGDFKAAYRDIEDGCTGLLEYCRREGSSLRRS